MLTRRSLSRALAAFLAMGLTSAFRGGEPRTGDNPKLAKLGLGINRESFVAIASCYLTGRTPGCPMPPDRILEDDISAVSDFDNLKKIALLNESSHLFGKIEQDFADGKVVSVDGWILSQTEVDLCVRVGNFRVT